MRKTETTIISEGNVTEISDSRVWYILQQISDIVLPPYKIKWPFKYLKIFLISVLVSVIGFFIVFYGVPILQDFSIHFMPKTPQQFSVDESNYLYYRDKSSTEKNIQKLEKKIAVKTPKSAYLVVNTYRNQFFLYKNKLLIREGLCSTGSYIKLQASDDQQWIFKTPRGEYKIRGKTTYPVWKKPDWAFIEEGLPVPSPNHPSRYEYGTLGDYALNLGYGYLIHGTLYQRFLGMPVTHGCVRLGDDDLKSVYSNLVIGSKVYIF